MKTKICGITQIQELSYLDQCKVNYVGFVFAKSKRQLSLQEAEKLRRYVGKSIQVVGVFVDAPICEIKEILVKELIDVVQLHGMETKGYVKALKRCTKKPIIKAITCNYHEHICYWNDSMVDFLLFDSGKGSGKTFDWNQIRGVTKPYFLAGGLHAGNVKAALDFLLEKGVPLPYALDVSSGVEKNGKKNKELINAWIKEVGGFYE